MASYHLSVKTVKRSVGRSVTAAAAYRAGERLRCEREGRVHDYTRKQGVLSAFVVSPGSAPDWVQDRAALWNAAEARESRRNAVTAREWELALPAELDGAAREDLAQGFAQALVDRYGVVCDVAIHAPHREGDQRNHHAHILTTTRVVDVDGFGAKTRILDAAKTGGAEIAAMREVWADMQNRALEVLQCETRVDHRSLEAQREDALARGDELAAMELNRDPEIKLGPAANAMERKAARMAEFEGFDYVPVTDRGAQNHQRCQQRDLLAELRGRAEAALSAWVSARAQEASRFDAAALAAKALFTSPGADDFARSFDAAWHAQEAARLREIEEERERERLRLLEEEKARLIEEIAAAWENTWRVEDESEAEKQQAELVKQVQEGAERLGVGFDDLAETINVQAEKIHETRVEMEKQRQLELEREQAEYTRNRDRGWDFGL